MAKVSIPCLTIDCESLIASHNKSGMCSTCYRRDLRKKHREKDPEAYRARVRKYSADRARKKPEAWKSSYQKAFKKYYQKNKEEIITKTTKYNKLNKEHLALKAKEYYEANKKEILRKCAKYYLENKEKVSLQAKEYRLKNRESINKKYKEKYYQDPQMRIKTSLRARMNRVIKNRGISKMGSVTKDLGCTSEVLVAHLEAQFQPGMSWDNYGSTGWHIDHIVPLARFDLTKEEEFKKAVHYLNLQPLWAEENIKKKDLTMEEWLVKKESSDG